MQEVHDGRSVSGGRDRCRAGEARRGGPLARRGLDFVVVEAGDDVAASVADWAHVRLFSPWRFNTDPTAHALLDQTGWTAPDPEVLPTGGDLISRYLAPLAAHPVIAPHLRFGSAVTAIALELPETGVCSSNLPDDTADDTADASCCGPAPADVPRGLATAVTGGLVTLPLVSVATGGDGCC